MVSLKRKSRHGFRSTGSRTACRIAHRGRGRESLPSVPGYGRRFAARESGSRALFSISHCFNSIIIDRTPFGKPSSLLLAARPGNRTAARRRLGSDADTPSGRPLRQDKAADVAHRLRLHANEKRRLVLCLLREDRLVAFRRESQTLSYPTGGSQGRPAARDLDGHRLPADRLSVPGTAPLRSQRRR